MTAPAGNGDGATSDQSQTTTTPPSAAPAEQSYTAPASQADLDRIIEQRLNRERAKYGMTPDEAKAFKEQFEALDAEGKSDAEKREKAARQAAAEEADAKYRPQLAETAFRIAIGDRLSANEVDDFIGDLNLTRFITDDGQVDTAKVLARVAQVTKTGDQQRTPAPKGPVIPAHGGGPVTSQPGDAAKAWLAKQGIKVDS